MPEGGVNVYATFRDSGRTITFVVSPSNAAVSLGIAGLDSTIIQNAATYTLSAGSAIIINSATDDYDIADLNCTHGSIIGNKYIVPASDDIVNITLSRGIPIDRDHFPDDVFRAFVAKTYDVIIKDGYLNKSEISQAKELDYRDSNARSLMGIEYFTALNYIELHETSITELDLSNNTALQTVHGSWNEQLVSVTLGKNSVLSLLHFPDSPIPVLDISGCPLIVDAYLNGSEEYSYDYTYHSYISDKGDLMVNKITQLVVASGKCGDNLTWALDGEGTLAITGTGEMKNYGTLIYGSFSDQPWFSYANIIKRVVISEGVTRIGSYAFGGFSNLISAEIPSSVTIFGYRTFYECTSLTGIHVDFANPVYCDINGVLFSKDKTEILCYPEGLAGDYSIPYGVTTVGLNAFENCNNLTGVAFPDSVLVIDSYAFSDCSRLIIKNFPSCLESISEGAFLRCNGLINIRIPASVTNIGISAFSYCDSLESIELSTSMTTIMTSVFYNCSSLARVIIPLGITKIYNAAFKGCDNLTDVYYGGTRLEWTTLLNTVSAENEPLFNATPHCNNSYCSVFFDANGGSYAPKKQAKTLGEALTLTSSLPYRSGWYFLGWAESSNAIDPDYRPGGIFTRDADTILYAVWGQPDFVLPAGITEIGEEAFASNAFRFAELPKHAVSIDPYAFANCSNLSYIFIPVEVTEIAPTAFGHKTEMTIYGAPGSKAETFAKEHGFNFINEYRSYIIVTR